MAENEVSLDAFITTPATEPQQDNIAEVVNLEDEFAKLLNDFIGQDSKSGENKTNSAQATEPAGLDSFLTSKNQG